MLVVSGGISPDYFLDEMTTWEIEGVLKAIESERRNDWERCRLSGFWQLLSMGAKLKSPKDLITFTWEKNEESQISNSIDADNQEVKLTKEEMAKLAADFDAYIN
jgi:hypothetical protein